MSTSSFSSRVQDAGATLRVARPAWMVGGPSGHRRLLLLALLGVAGLLAIVYLTFRLTPLSTVQRVTVVGVQGPDAPEIRQAIERAAMGQSTLGFGDAAVKRAVSKTASITGVTVHAKFPHAVQVEVQQLLAVGAVDAGGRKVAVAADGRLLPDWDVGELPLIRGARADRDVVRGSGLLAASILGVAPADLLAHVARVDDGTVVRLADGPALLFRDTNRLNAKWAAAVAVLGDPGTAGATWIDLRVPEAPVAGKGAPPALPAKDAKVGRVAGVSDALATAERAALATGGPTADTPGASDATAPAAAPTTPSTTVAAEPSTAAAAVPSTTAAPVSGGSPTGAATTSGTASPGTGAVSPSTNSGAVATPAASAPGAASTGTSGGGTAPTAQTAP